MALTSPLLPAMTLCRLLGTLLGLFATLATLFPTLCIQVTSLGTLFPTLTTPFPALFPSFAAALLPSFATALFPSFAAALFTAFAALPAPLALVSPPMLRTATRLPLSRRLLLLGLRGLMVLLGAGAACGGPLFGGRGRRGRFRDAQFDLSVARGRLGLLARLGSLAWLGLLAWSFWLLTLPGLGVLI